jgi:hypothetical protein
MSGIDVGVAQAVLPEHDDAELVAAVERVGQVAAGCRPGQERSRHGKRSGLACQSGNRGEG